MLWVSAIVEGQQSPLVAEPSCPTCPVTGDAAGQGLMIVSLFIAAKAMARGPGCAFTANQVSFLEFFPVSEFGTLEFSKMHVMK